jgi:hypothetical protein
MNRDKFASMIEDAHRNKVLHLVGRFLTDSREIERFYKYVRRNDNEPETQAILNTLGIKTVEAQG